MIGDGWAELLLAFGSVFCIGLSLACAIQAARCAVARKSKETPKCIWRGWIRLPGGWKWVIDCHENANDVEACRRLDAIHRDHAFESTAVISSVRLPADETPTCGGMLKDR